MATHTIAPEHLDALTRGEHVLSYLQAEAARKQAEMESIALMFQREKAKVDALAMAYGITGQYTLDTKHGVITTPETPDERPTAE